MKLEPKSSPEHVLSFQNTVLFKMVSKQRSGAVSDGERCFLDLPDTAGAHREGLAAPPPPNLHEKSIRFLGHLESP